MKRVNKEEARCRIFERYREAAYPHVLHSYNKPEEYFPDDRLALETAGDSDTNAFREFLKDYINAYRPEQLIKGKPYMITLNSEGQFIVMANGKKVKQLSTSEKTIYHYLCFLNTARFWQEFEKMRNLHYEPKPLIIKNLVEKLDDSVDLNILIKKAKELNRGVVLVL